MYACYMANPSNQLAQGLSYFCLQRLGLQVTCPLRIWMGSTCHLRGKHIHHWASSLVTFSEFSWLFMFLTILKACQCIWRSWDLVQFASYTYLGKLLIYLHSMKTFLEGHVVQSEDRLVDGALGMMAWMHKSADGNTGPWGPVLKSRSIDSYLPISCCIAGTYSTYISDALI